MDGGVCGGQERWEVGGGGYKGAQEDAPLVDRCGCECRWAAGKVAKQGNPDRVRMDRLLGFDALHCFLDYNEKQRALPY